MQNAGEKFEPLWMVDDRDLTTPSIHKALPCLLICNVVCGITLRGAGDICTCIGSHGLVPQTLVPRGAGPQVRGDPKEALHPREVPGDPHRRWQHHVAPREQTAVNGVPADLQRDENM